jgi:hypothetical protein
MSRQTVLICVGRRIASPSGLHSKLASYRTPNRTRVDGPLVSSEMMWYLFSLHPPLRRRRRPSSLRPPCSRKWSGWAWRRRRRKRRKKERGNVILEQFLLTIYNYMGNISALLAFQSFVKNENMVIIIHYATPARGITGVMALPKVYTGSPRAWAQSAEAWELPSSPEELSEKTMSQREGISYDITIFTSKGYPFRSS